MLVYLVFNGREHLGKICNPGQKTTIIDKRMSYFQGFYKTCGPGLFRGHLSGTLNTVISLLFTSSKNKPI